MTAKTRAIKRIGFCVVNLSHRRVGVSRPRAAEQRFASNQPLTDADQDRANHLVRQGDAMLTSSRYLVNGSPRCCMFCGEPFRPRDGYVEFWRTSAGQHFCSEFCADDAEEALFRRRRAAVSAAPVAGSPHI